MKEHNTLFASILLQNLWTGLFNVSKMSRSLPFSSDFTFFGLYVVVYCRFRVYLLDSTMMMGRETRGKYKIKSELQFFYFHVTDKAY